MGMKGLKDFSRENEALVSTEGSVQGHTETWRQEEICPFKTLQTGLRGAAQTESSGCEAGRMKRRSQVSSRPHTH